VPYANLTNPQTLNLYAIVSDNPETFADLDGHCWNWICKRAAHKAAAENSKPGQDLAFKVQIQAQQNGITTVTLTSTDASVTTNKDGSITMTTTTTTQTYNFNQAGNLISGQSQTVGTAFTMKGDQYSTKAINSSSQLTARDAVRTFGGTDFSHLDTRGMLARFPGTVAADAAAHPVKYGAKVAELGALFIPGAQEAEGFKLSLELHVAAVELVNALEGR
jgi:hypothetical protein